MFARRWNIWFTDYGAGTQDMGITTGAASTPGSQSSRGARAGLLVAGDAATDMAQHQESRVGKFWITTHPPCSPTTGSTPTEKRSCKREQWGTSYRDRGRWQRRGGVGLEAGVQGLEKAARRRYDATQASWCLDCAVERGIRIKGATIF